MNLTLEKSLGRPGTDHLNNGEGLIHEFIMSNYAKGRQVMKVTITGLSLLGAAWSGAYAQADLQIFGIAEVGIRTTKHQAA